MPGAAAAANQRAAVENIRIRARDVVNVVA
jgi:hypothetical protein